jgi:hypothetical protein
MKRTKGGDSVRRLIYIGVIVAILAIMIVPPLGDSRVGSTEICKTKTFSYYHSGLYVYGRATAWEEPYRKVQIYFSVWSSSGMYRIYPAAELYSEPYPDPYEPNSNVLCKYYFEEDVPPGSVYYNFTLREDEDSPAVFGRALFGVEAAEPYGKVLDIYFITGVAPTIVVNEGLSTQLYNQMCQWEGEDPSGFY